MELGSSAGYLRLTGFSCMQTPAWKRMSAPNNLHASVRAWKHSKGDGYCTDGGKDGFCTLSSRGNAMADMQMHFYRPHPEEQPKAFSLC